VKELDFLPEWYKDDRRRQMHVRRQYVALAVIFLLMMLFNGTAIHRAGRAAAEGARLENQRVGAEAVVREFDALTKQLNDLRGRAGLIDQIDSRIEVATVLAELSHVIGDSVVLRKVEIQAEPFSRPQDQRQAKGSVVRLSDRPANADKEMPLGRVKFRIVLAGVAVHPADVANLVCQLDASTYFQRVHPSFYGNVKTPAGAKSARGPQADGKPPETLGLTEFEITCYLANYKEVDD